MDERIGIGRLYLSRTGLSLADLLAFLATDLPRPSASGSCLSTLSMAPELTSRGSTAINKSGLIGLAIMARSSIPEPVEDDPASIWTIVLKSGCSVSTLKFLKNYKFFFKLFEKCRNSLVVEDFFVAFVPLVSGRILQCRQVGYFRSKHFGYQRRCLFGIHFGLFVAIERMLDQTGRAVLIDIGDVMDDGSCRRQDRNGGDCVDGRSFQICQTTSRQ